MYKILYISAIFPDTTSGGRFAMYRHLILKKDFDIAVASTNYVELPIKYQLTIKQNRLIERLRRTCLCRLIYNLEYLFNWLTIPDSLRKFAEDFKPDAILCVVDDWHLGLAVQLSKKLQVPLIVNFQDLFCFSQFVPKLIRPYPFIKSFLYNRYQQVSQSANQVFYTSEGMKQWFGLDAKGDVLYPVGDFEVRVSKNAIPSFQGKINVIYAGNCYEAYGRMLLRLAELVRKNQDIKLQIFAAGNDWNPEQIQEMRNVGIYQGFKPFNELKYDLEQADAFLTVMSFEQAEKTFMQTSFTTKWLDYVPYGKPVFVWAPEYSTAFKFARQHQAGIAVCEDEPEALLKAIIDCAENFSAWSSACAASRQVAETVLNAEKIHELFVKRINEVCQQYENSKR